MICYRDRSFCSQECANLECDRNFTPTERERARKWWGGEGVPVSMMDHRHDECGYVAPEGRGHAKNTASHTESKG